MKVVFLGTNGWYDTPVGNTICILIETGSSIILLDAGSGLYKADRYF
ncbi:MAG: ribonuclease Z, partial [Chlorobiaceae bacterium]|nr:ribonuclease Z [Chlorobiaceae bacterium]